MNCSLPVRIRLLIAGYGMGPNIHLLMRCRQCEYITPTESTVFPKFCDSEAPCRRQDAVSIQTHGPDHWYPSRVNAGRSRPVALAPYAYGRGNRTSMVTPEVAPSKIGAPMSGVVNIQMTMR
eukprot:4869050-Pleurochrysis_carterae.AAC.2